MRITMNQHCTAHGCRRGNQYVHCGSASRRAYSQSHPLASDGFIHVHDFTQQRPIALQFCVACRRVNPKLVQAQIKLEQCQDRSSRHDCCILKKSLNASRSRFGQVVGQQRRRIRQVSHCRSSAWSSLSSCSRSRIKSTTGSAPGFSQRLPAPMSWRARSPRLGNAGSTSIAVSSLWTHSKNFRRSRGGNAFTCSNTSFALIVPNHTTDRAFRANSKRAFSRMTPTRLPGLQSSRTHGRAGKNAD
jgi:hypothetical protein